jgi:hypothetical protein
LTMAVALLPGLADDLDDVEEELIEEYLDKKLSARDLAGFQSQYVEGDQENRGKLAVQEMLRRPEAIPDFEVQPETAIAASSPPLRSASPRLAWTLAVAASIAAVAFGSLFFNQSRQLNKALADLRTQHEKKNALEPEPHDARKEGPVITPKGPAAPQEQAAGFPSGDGLTLRAGASPGKTVAVATAPRRLIWAPVPDDHAEYRIEVRSANGATESSLLIDPRDGAIAYQIVDPAALELPWQVLITGSPDNSKILGSYKVAKR